MLRRKLLIFAVLCGSAHGALLPEWFGNYKRTEIKPVVLPDRRVWDEYGFDAAEQAVYRSGANKMLTTAYRLKDPTGALAAFQWLRPDDATPLKLAEYAAGYGDSSLLLMGNYVLSFQGNRPTPADLKQIFVYLPRYDQSSLPSLRNHLPADHLIVNSQRYVLGPASLQKFEPRIAPSLAAFHLGAEAQLARYKTKNGESQLAVFSYPTPQMARERVDAFHKIDGVVAKRSGPLVAVIVSPPDADDAERILSQVRFEQEITWSQKIPKPQGNPGDMLMGICILAAVLIGLSVLFGFFLGGFRVALARFGIGSAHDAFTSLQIGKK
ncbi:MAG: DUF6599 family protein [Bryobacteraceae bacterium]